MPKPVLVKGWTNPATFGGAPPVISSEQLVLFPRRTLFEYASPEGKDISAFVQADNGRGYYLKLDKGDIPVRANEWLSYRLAALVGIPTPRCDFIQTNDGDIAFGSEAVNGASKQAETILYLEKYTLMELGSSAPSLRASLSAIHTFDLFLNNVDRHFGNFLVSGHGDERQLLSIDFARSVYWRWPWTEFLKHDDTTMEAWSDLRQRHGFDIDAAVTVLDRLRIITPQQIASMIKQMPKHWLTDAARNELVAYCRDGGWAARCGLLRKGLENGSIV